MKKRSTIILGLTAIVILSAAIVMFYRNFSSEANQPTQLVDNRWAQSDLRQEQHGPVYKMTPRRQYKARAPFYIDQPASSPNSFTFMYYASDKRSFFYRFDLRLNKPQKLFEIKGNIDSGAVVGDGNGVVYREMVNGGYLEGNLCYRAKDQAPRRILKQCNWYQISPDQKKILAGGIPYNDPKPTGRKVYLFSIERGVLTELPGAASPETWEDLLGFRASWSSNSHYVSMENTIFDAESAVLLKKLTLGEATLSMLTWSPDGQKMAFAVQSAANDKYTIAEENSELRLSDKLGVYNIKDGTIKYAPFPDSFAVNYIWSQDSAQLLATLIPANKAADYIGASRNTNQPDLYNLSLIDSATMAVKVLFNDFPVVETIFLTHDILIMTTINGGESHLTGCQIQTKTTRDLTKESFARAMVHSDRIYLMAPGGIYRVDQNMQITKLLRRTEGAEELLFPEHKKVVVVGASDNIQVIHF